MAGCRISLCDEHRSGIMKACISKLSAVVMLCLVVVHLLYTNTSLWSNQPFSSWPSILIFMFFLYLDLCNPHINATSNTFPLVK